MTSRETIFISHATPDDNDFVRWLGTRLIGHGYRAWADLFELKGGAPFWSSIEECLKQHACKMIFVVSRRSVDPERSGVRNELSVADAMKKALRDPGFIIPVRIDDTPFADLPIQIHQLSTIDFSSGWGARLIELLDTLKSAGVPRTDDDQTAQFEHWLASMVRVSTIVEEAPEPVLTNLLSILEMPGAINVFGHEGDKAEIKAALTKTGVPHVTFLRLVLAFAEGDAFQERLPSSFALSKVAEVPLVDFLDGRAEGVTVPRRKEARNMVTSLLNRHFERHLEGRGLRRYETSSGPSFFFPSGLIPDDRVPYADATGRQTRKQVVGRSEKRKVHWHLAMKVNLVLGPPGVVRLKPYVCFSDDGQTAIADPRRTSAIRRGFCRSWWNPHWRQLQQAFSVFLADGDDRIAIALNGPAQLVLGGRLLQLSVARRMPNDLKVAEDPVEPEEPDEEDEDIYDPESLMVEDAP